MRISDWSSDVCSSDLAVDLLSGGERSLFVSHYWDSETAKAQAYILDRLENRFGKEAFKSLRVRLGFDKYHLTTGETENTQRGRSFLFYSLATQIGRAQRLNSSH